MTEQQLTILVVDDEPDVGRYIAATLCRRGFNAILAVGGKAALNEYYARKRDGRAIHLVLTDIVMNDLAGPDLARAINELDPNARVLYMSGYRRDHIERFGEELGPDEVLSKPFTPTELVNAVRKAITSSTTAGGANIAAGGASS